MYLGFQKDIDVFCRKLNSNFTEQSAGAATLEYAEKRLLRLV